MPACVAGVHVLNAFEVKDMDGRNKPGHDAGGRFEGRHVTQGGRDFMGRAVDQRQRQPTVVSGRRFREIVDFRDETLRDSTSP
jgi:hypothetical protein